MANKQGKRYSSEFKFEVVMEALTRAADDAAIARKHGVHPVTLSNWKTHFLDHGSEVFARKKKQGEDKKKIARLEQMLGRKEVELALAKNFLKKS